MKNAILMVAAMGMFGGAFASESTTVTQPVSATVSNVCTYNVPDGTDVSGKTFNQSATAALSNYTALSGATGSVAKGSFYIFRCTSGTGWTAPSDSSIEMTSSSSTHNLVVNYHVTDSADLDTANGDIHSAGLELTADAGQWRAHAGNYTGTVSVTISYN